MCVCVLPAKSTRWSLDPTRDKPNRPYAAFDGGGFDVEGFDVEGLAADGIDGLMMELVG